MESARSQTGDVEEKVISIQVLDRAVLSGPFKSTGTIDKLTVSWNPN
jgi:hypothetical protein